MTDDLLKAAARALREETENPQPGADFTRARVMASLHKTRERRRTRLVLLLPIAATFAAASAFATNSGRLPAIVQTVAVALGLKAKPEPASKPRSRALAKPIMTAPPPVPAPGPALSVEPQVVTPPVPAPSVDAPAQPSIPHASNAASARPPELDPTHGLYLEAHRAHFEQANYARALPAWEDYLRKAPNGRFALEARFNRAVCLIRLGRLSEARSALEPFAMGRTGGYRQHEASELLDSLDQ